LPSAGLLQDIYNKSAFGRAVITTSYMFMMRNDGKVVVVKKLHDMVTHG